MDRIRGVVWSEGVFRFACSVGLLLSVTAAGSAQSQIDLDTAASYFGKHPSVWGMRMSPDGSKISFLTQHPDDLTIAVVRDLGTGEANLIAASDAKKGMSISQCRWASNARLLCWYYGIAPFQGHSTQHTRVIAVDSTGANMKVLIQSQQSRSDNWSNIQGGLVDLLPEDPKHVLMEIREKNGYGVARVDIEKNRTKTVVRPKQTIWGYQSDGRGQVRLREDHDRAWVDIEYRLDGETKWHSLCRDRQDGESDCGGVLGFGEDPNDILVVGDHQGRQALYRWRLTGEKAKPEDRELVYAHPTVDVWGGVRLGRHGRVVGVKYVTDVPHTDYFEPAIKKLVERLSEEIPTKGLALIDESWDRRYYLVRGGSDVKPASYFRYDTETDGLARLTSTYVWLDDVDLAPMRLIKYASAEGVTVPAYLSSVSRGTGPAPLVVLPHGGPSYRDVWGFDWLVQFLASQGYMVLQPNYRGSAGYGDEWEGSGGYKRWRDVAADIHAGVEHLVASGQVDPDRVCLVGWSFGGYASLMTAIENPDRYRCVVSVAGVTHPRLLLNSLRRNQGDWIRRFRRNQLPDGEEIRRGSAVSRAEEMTAPVLLLHGDLDVNVSLEHSEDLASALRKADKVVEMIEYEDEDHAIRNKQANTIDLLQRIGDFLSQHMKKRPES